MSSYEWVVTDRFLSAIVSVAEHLLDLQKVPSSIPGTSTDVKDLDPGELWPIRADTTELNRPVI